ncbi:MAG: hypothetical protein PVH29_06830 [Candidatus Zixiibacteriota bacterium]|jgi:hypothetical protein
MGTDKIRRLLLAAAAGALLASAAAASSYNYEGKWQEYLGVADWEFEIGPISGDDSKVAVPYICASSIAAIDVGCRLFDANGAYLGYCKYFLSSYDHYENGGIYGCAAVGEGAVTTFTVHYYDLSEEIYKTESHLSYGPNPSWDIKEDGWGRFKALARTPDGQSFYCYRLYSGDYRICKMTVAGTVTSYFTPLAVPDDMAVDASGNIYGLSGGWVFKYDASGSLITSWDTPVTLNDVCVDANDRILGFSNSNMYTYVFSDAGSLLGSFTAPYESITRHGSTGPDGKYFVACEAWDQEIFICFVEMYRFAPVPTNIVPTSLGKIKAMYQ